MIKIRSYPYLPVPLNTLIPHWAEWTLARLLDHTTHLLWKCDGRRATVHQLIRFTKGGIRRFTFRSFQFNIRYLSLVMERMNKEWEKNEKLIHEWTGPTLHLSLALIINEKWTVWTRKRTFTRSRPFCLESCSRWHIKRIEQWMFHLSRVKKNESFTPMNIHPSEPSDSLLRIRRACWFSLFSKIWYQGL